VPVSVVPVSIVPVSIIPVSPIAPVSVVPRSPHKMSLFKNAVYSSSSSSLFGSNSPERSGIEMYMDYARNTIPRSLSVSPSITPFESPTRSLSPDTSVYRIKSLHSSPGTPSTLFHIYSHKEKSSHGSLGSVSPISPEKVRVITQMHSTIYTVNPQTLSTIIPYSPTIYNKNTLQIFMSSVTEL
jgi:hypothetical protein